MSLAVIQTDIAPMFTKATHECELGDEALYGMIVEAQPSLDGWSRIRTHYRYEGFAPTACLNLDPFLVEGWQRSVKLTVMAPYADILREPKVQGARLASVPRGGLVLPEGEAVDGWQPVRLAAGGSGYIMAGHLAPAVTGWDVSREEELRKSLCETALLYLGAQYRWGGKTPLGIDCSGLTSMAYLLNGSVIYRDASVQPGFEMKRIDPRDVRQGDLLFFPGHVAMYLGDSRYIHSTAKAGSDGVVINSLYPSHEDYRQDLAERIEYAGTIF